MLARTIIIAAMLCGAVAMTDDVEETKFTQLERLSSALQKFSNPDPASKRITTWRQGGGTGVSTTHDADTSTLTQAIGSWADGCAEMDLANVAIVSEDGRSIRFIDYTKHKQEDGPLVNLVRGDIVLLMTPADDK